MSNQKLKRWEQLKLRLNMVREWFVRQRRKRQTPVPEDQLHADIWEIEAERRKKEQLQARQLGNTYRSGRG